MAPFNALRLRSSLLSKVIVVWFAVLIVLPFTAPFRVWERGAPISKAQRDDLKLEKLAKDATVALSRIVYTGGFASPTRGPRLRFPPRRFL